MTLGVATALMTSGLALAPLSAPAAGAATPVTITTPSPLPDATVNSPYSVTLQASGGTPPYWWQWGIDPNSYREQLPPGLSFPSSGTISGTPTEWGTFEFYVFVGDSASPQGQYVRYFVLNVQPLTPPPLVITTTSVPNARVGSAYSANLQASGGVPPYVWSLKSGSLPNGLSLSSSGTISGTPHLPQTASFTVQVVDTGAQSGTDVYAPGQQTATQPLSMAVGSGNPTTDSTLEALGNEVVAAAASVNVAIANVLAVVTPAIELVQGQLPYLEFVLGCLDGTSIGCKL
ncbi:MAG TPA: Ig domain-containing protein [Acidimicrobiales bacterium]|nr:Ig domain-containing protein [Acidimicrobiales bacterium]